MPEAMDSMLLLVLLVLPSCASCQTTVHVCANETEASTQNCVTFSKCLSETTSCFSSNTTLLFEPGVYHVTNDTIHTPAVIVRNMVNLHLKGMQEGNNIPTTEIVCHTGVSFTFTGILNLSLSDIGFIQCGADILPSVREEMLREMRSFLNFRGTLRVALLVANSRGLTLKHVHLNNSHGVGLLAVNALGLSVTNSVFFGNNWDAAIERFGLHEKSLFNARQGVFKGGNAVLLFTDTKHNGFKCGKTSNTRKRYTIDVSSSTFMQGVHIDYNDIKLPLHFVKSAQYNFTVGGGLSMVLSQRNYNLDITIKSITSSQNFAYLGANLCIFLYDIVKNSKITITNSSFNKGNGLLPFRKFSYSTVASGLNYIYGFPTPLEFVCKKRQKLTSYVKLTINKVSVSENIAHFGAGFSIWDLNRGRKSLKCCHNVTINNCNFTYNTASVASAMYIFEDQRFVERVLPYRTSLANVSFEGNKVLSSDEFGHHLPQSFYSLSNKLQCAVAVDGVWHTTFSNCTFEDNHVTALFVVSSWIVFKEINKLSHNNGTFGGALAFYGRAIMQLMPDSHLSITDNHAEYMGGGIYVSSIANFYIDSPCFYQVSFGDNIANQTTLTAEVYMQGNTAGISGGTIYGGNMDSCEQIYIKGKDSLSTFQQVFVTPDVNFSVPQTGISSHPLGPCFCSADGEPQCSESETNRTVFTGEMFNVSVVGVGQFNGTTPAVILSRVYADNFNNVDLENSHHSMYAQKLSNECQNITYRVHARKYAEIVLLAETLNYRYFTRTINVHIRECPIGFRLSDGAYPRCECKPQLQGHCNPGKGTVTRSGTMWMGYFSNSTLFHKHCPLDYCKPEELTMQLNESQKQCMFNRVGILCGKCKDGLSLMLGTSQCKLCSNTFLALLAVMALAGVLLVVVLFLCNLTVAKGTLNAIIFYASVIRINHAIFFPHTRMGSAIHVIGKILTVFIAWLNLDLGLETCFYNGMDGYTKTWLQFAFPAYIWVIAFLVIIASRYSSVLQKVCMSNAVPVLATLFLLSYAKLQRTIITSLSCTWLDYEDRREMVWLYDGNVQCFKGKHTVLALAAIVVGTFFILPAMLFLLLSRQLQAGSTCCLLSWVNNLKPLLDAYQGPYKDTYRHWIGLILLVQNLLFVSFAFNAVGSATVNCFTVAVMIVLLLPLGWKSGGIYKHSPKNILECFFHINLGILAATSLYIHSSKDIYTQEKQIYVSYAFIGAAFVIFMGILIFHAIQRAMEFPQLEKALIKVSRLPAIMKLCKLLGCKRTPQEDPLADTMGEEHLYEMVITPRTREDHSSTSLTNPSLSGELREPLLEELRS